MQDFKVGQYEDANKKKSGVISTLLTAILILLLFIPLFSYVDPPPGQEGILVNLGEIDLGQGDDNAPPAKTQAKESKPEPEPESKPEPEKPQEKPKVEPPKPTPKPEPIVKETVVTEDPDAIRIKKEKEKKKREQEIKEQEEREEHEREQQEELERQREKEAERRAEEAKKAKEAAERKRKADAAAKAKEIDGLFGDGGGKGNTGKPGNQGDPNGDPNSDILEGKSTGAGKIGGGLGGRGILSAPKLTDNSQDTGVVVVDACVDRNGNVTKAEIRQTRTTTTSSRLKRLAVANAKKYRFKSDGSAPQAQCGTITYDFKVR